MINIQKEHLSGSICPGEQVDWGECGEHTGLYCIYMYTGEKASWLPSVPGGLRGWEAPPARYQPIKRGHGSPEGVLTRHVLPPLPARGQRSTWVEVLLPPGEGGYSVCKRVLTAVRPLESGGCHNPWWLKKGVVLLLYRRIGELSESGQLIFIIR